MKEKAPFPKSWWVEDGLLLAGCFPGDPDQGEARKKLQGLLDAGVRVFISLQEPEETSPWGPFAPYMPLAEQLAREAGMELEHVNFPIVDLGVPTKEFMAAILEKIRQARSAGRCVYVHCWGGHGRTATVVGCWLREQGLTGEEALERIADLRRHDPYLAGQRSPQTHAQRKMILEWQPLLSRTAEGGDSADETRAAGGPEA